MITSFKWWFVRVSNRHHYQCFWRINFSNNFCIQNHLFINISSLSLSKTLLSFDLNRSINSIFHFIFSIYINSKMNVLITFSIHFTDFNWNKQFILHILKQFCFSFKFISMLLNDKSLEWQIYHRVSCSFE